MRLALLLLAFFSFKSFSQPAKPNAVEIHQQIKKLNFLGSVLYIAAHPDDENTRLISYFSNHVHARTGYLSLTRGDGGQNLVGPELRELLGVIRTQELVEARKIDGGEQFFSRANDFGYSKLPDETLSIWDKDQVLSDVVRIIRKFRPDVIVNRFDHRTPGTTHGHHTASALLSLEAFDLAGSVSAYQDQLSDVKPWTPARVFFNTSFWFYGGKEKFDKADKSNLYQLPIGTYFASLGKSNQEIAALSRSRHQSQGFGSTGVRGEETEYLEFIKGIPPANRSDLFEGIDTSWNRVENGAPIGKLLMEIEREYDFKDPAASIPKLVEAYKLISALKDDHWRKLKSEEVANIILACGGIFLEAVAPTPDATPQTNLSLNIEAINRSGAEVVLKTISAGLGTQLTPMAKLEKNRAHFEKLSIAIPNQQFTQPYWLEKPSTGGMYRVDNTKLIGRADIEPAVRVAFLISVNGLEIPVERVVVYKYNDDVKGEVYEPFRIVPDVTSSILEKVSIFRGRRGKPVAVTVRAGKDNISGEVMLELPDDWTVTPQSIPFSLERKGSEFIANFSVVPPKNSGEATARSIVHIGQKTFDREKIDIGYSHITKQTVLKPAEAQFIKPDLRTGDEKIAYIMGAGDEVYKSLSQMGYDVTVLAPNEISREKLSEFDVVITGIRAYNTVKELAVKQKTLLEFVYNGGTMIVQYNTLDDFVTKEFAPYPLKISRDRVTEESAEVRFLEPAHRVLNYPNKITTADFAGWKQEQGLYYPSEWDKSFTPILSANDKGENPKNGALLIADYGKGKYIYTGLSFFRELPEGVTGAFRLFANMISIGN